MADNTATFRMDPIRLGALLGAVIAFVGVGAIYNVLWVAAGALVGAAAGYGVRHLARQAATFADAEDLQQHASRDDLYSAAQQLDIAGRSNMTRDELAMAVAEARTGG